jgi:hypothetical protein
MLKSRQILASNAVVNVDLRGIRYCRNQQAHDQEHNVRNTHTNTP